MISVMATHLLVKAIEGVSMNEHACVLIKLYL